MPKKKSNEPTPVLKYKSCWHAPGYRSLGVVMVDPDGREYQLSIGPKELQRLINDCADAAKQIGGHPPIDWEEYPHSVYWPEVKPWIAGTYKKTA
jgi:hypothetical protein